MIHQLKSWPDAFQAVWEGYKTFEWRYDDRRYKLGDILEMSEWLPDNQAFTGRYIRAEVTYLLRGRFGVPDGFVVMSIKVLQREVER